MPPENLAALRSVREQLPGVTIATGERIHARHEFRELFELRAADVIQFDVTHIGGLLESKKLAAQADVHYVTVAPHNVGGQISTAANLHLAACTTNFRVQEYFNDFADPWVKDTAPGCPEVVDGYFALPTAPGPRRRTRRGRLCRAPGRDDPLQPVRGGLGEAGGFRPLTAPTSTDAMGSMAMPVLRPRHGSRYAGTELLKTLATLMSPCRTGARHETTHHRRVRRRDRGRSDDRAA